MTERNPNRKSDRSFNLGKGGQHSFDLEKKTSRKFDLGKDDQSTVLPVSEPSIVDTDNEGTNKGVKKTIIWIVVALIIAAIIAFFCFRSCNSDKDELQPADEQEMTTTSDEANTNSDDEGEVTPINGEVEDAQIDPEGDEPQPVDTPVEQPQAEGTKNIPAQPAVESAPLQTVSSDIETEAMNVIRGDYGVGQERKDRLGSQYSAIQARVNEMKRQGLF